MLGMDSYDLERASQRGRGLDTGLSRAAGALELEGLLSHRPQEGDLNVFLNAITGMGYPLQEIAEALSVEIEGRWSASLRDRTNTTIRALSSESTAASPCLYVGLAISAIPGERHVRAVGDHATVQRALRDHLWSLLGEEEERKLEREELEELHKEKLFVMSISRIPLGALYERPEGVTHLTFEGPEDMSSPMALDALGRVPRHFLHLLATQTVQRKFNVLVSTGTESEWMGRYSALSRIEISLADYNIYLTFTCSRVVAGVPETYSDTFPLSRINGYRAFGSRV